VGVGSAGAGAAVVCECGGVGGVAAGGAAGVWVSPQGESWNQDLRDASRVRFERGKQVQMGKGRSGLNYCRISPKHLKENTLVCNAWRKPMLFGYRFSGNKM
jgi:hypothetical protein